MGRQAARAAGEALLRMDSASVAIGRYLPAWAEPKDGKAASAGRADRTASEPTRLIMKKVLTFSLLLVLGLVASQLLPGLLGADYASFKMCSDTLLYVCLAFIMINVGREFEIEKGEWRSYVSDYFIAMATAAVPWIFITLYYMFVMLPSVYWGDAEAWKENLLLSRFAAPTSAGILFTMLAALHLKSSWMYRKIQVLAIFDDLDTILLMIPLQIAMIGLQWQMFVVVAIVTLLLVAGWRKLGHYDLRQDWKSILLYAVVVFALTQGALRAHRFAVRRVGRHSYRGAPARLRVGHDDASPPCGFGGRGARVVVRVVPVHVSGRRQYAAVHRRAARRGIVRPSFGDGLAAHDVVGDDRRACADRLAAVESRQALSRLFSTATAN